jgi:anti-sigma factor RsiW
MLCDQDPVTLAAYLDGELPPEQVVTLQEHISGCPNCALEIAELVRLKQSLRAARSHFTPSAEFRQRIQKQVAAPRRRQKIFRLIPVTLAPTIVALAAVLILAITWIQYSRRANAFSEVADLHVNALASSNPLDVVSTDRHTVKPWFQGKIPFSFNVPEFKGTEFSLLGGRMVYLHQLPGAQLIVAMRQHKISVLIFEQSPALGNPFLPTAGAGSHNAFNVETWQSKSLRFFVIGDAEASEIDKLSQSLKQANQ